MKKMFFLVTLALMMLLLTACVGGTTGDTSPRSPADVHVIDDDAEIVFSITDPTEDVSNELSLSW